MKRNLLYLISAICFSIGTYFLHTDKQSFAPILFCLPSLLLLNKGELNKPISFNKSKWSGVFTSELFAILGFTLFMMLIVHLGEEGWLNLTSKWYFVVKLWLLCLTGLSRRYIQEKQKAQPEHRPYSEQRPSIRSKSNPESGHA
jgi:hypothetical protein